MADMTRATMSPWLRKPPSTHLLWSIAPRTATCSHASWATHAGRYFTCVLVFDPRRKRSLGSFMISTKSPRERSRTHSYLPRISDRRLPQNVLQKALRPLQKLGKDGWEDYARLKGDSKIRRMRMTNKKLGVAKYWAGWQLARRHLGCRPKRPLTQPENAV